MLNLFAATGHVYYAKSARLYLQQMLKLPKEHPWLYKQFVEFGYHTIRRTECGGGLSPDLVIEQAMMRSLKSRGGLTRGRGFTESVRNLWVLTVHRCAEVHGAMSTLTRLTLGSSEQHIELSAARKSRDFSDLTKNRRVVFNPHTV